MAELAHVRRFPAEEKRVETGPVMFGDDWPGIFIRGDDAAMYVASLREILLDKPDIGLITKRVLMGLLDDLESSNASNNDAFPAWHQPGGEDDRDREKGKA
jgi:hypothetical protein